MDIPQKIALDFELLYDLIRSENDSLGGFYLTKIDHTLDFSLREYHMRHLDLNMLVDIVESGICYELRKLGINFGDTLVVKDIRYIGIPHLYDRTVKIITSLEIWRKNE